ncbi:MAG TPA: polynucleotide adenylyltransferase PcnB, partial [Burkholderiaceae bacterium]|nr:polynucleotide adenylyltransferase PcnB [Burkholderiaceae bacterium]
VAPSFLLACVLWADVRDGWASRMEGRHGQRGQPSFPALQDAIEDVFNARIGDVSGRGKLAGDMREIWMMQPRFEKRTGSTPFGLVEQPRFRAAFDFMRLRADAGEIDEVLADWWQEFSMADDNLRQDMVDEVREEQQQRPRMTRAPRPANAAAPAAPRQAADAEASGAEQDDGEPRQVDGTVSDAPRKRRRRRRSGGPRDGGAAGPAAPDAGS